MDPFTIAALASAGGNVLSSVLGARAGNEAANYNLAANYANIAAGERADLRGQIAAQMQRARDEQGVTDAAGNRVYYDPGRGWVTELSPDQQSLQTATTAAQQYNLGPGERMRQEGVERSADAQRGENQTADTLLRQFDRRARTDPGALAEQIYAAGELGRTASEDRLHEAMATQNVRAGNTSNIDDILAARAREGSRASEEARRQAVLQAPDIAQQRDASNATNTADLYNMFRQRAVNPTGVPFSPVSPQGPQRPSTGLADAAIINSVSRRPPQLDYMQPNYANANAIAQVGTGVSNALQQAILGRQMQQANERLFETDRLRG